MLLEQGFLSKCLQDRL